MKRATKIIATIGPGSCSPKILKGLVSEGMDLARFNFSHGTTSEFSEWLQRLKETSRETKKEIGILQDLQGPRIRIEGVSKRGLQLISGRILHIATSPKEQKKGQLLIYSPEVTPKISVGDRILIDNGVIELSVEKVLDGEIKVKIMVGGMVFNRKGVNLPATALKTHFTAKDEEDLKWGIKNKVQYIALSFVEGPEDVECVRKKLPVGGPKILAKIEKETALKKIDQILDVAEGIMVARGDLGVEVTIPKLPLIQKRLIQRAKAKDKFVIVATQMLTNMTVSPCPTRAEVSDIANAVLDGADALMLSEETAVGKHPVEALKVMRETIEDAEEFKKGAESLDEILK